MKFCDKKSKFEIGDKVKVNGEVYEVMDIGILGSKLSDWIFVYQIKNENKILNCVNEAWIEKIVF